MSMGNIDRLAAKRAEAAERVAFLAGIVVCLFNESTRGELRVAVADYEAAKAAHVDAVFANYNEIVARDNAAAAANQKEAA